MRRDLAADLRRLAAGEKLDAKRLLRVLPDDIDPELAADAIVRAKRSFPDWPAPVIRAVLGREQPGWQHLFRRLAVPVGGKPAAIRRAWNRALDAIAHLHLSYAWGSKQLRAKFRGLARDPLTLAAIQGTLAHASDLDLPRRLRMMAVLCTDGSDASVDAMVTHVDKALATGEDLKWLARLRTHARPTPAILGLLDQIDAALGERHATSPALALGPVIGIGRVEPLWFRVRLPTHDQLLVADISIDSRRDNWFRITIQPSLRERDLRCETAADIPAFLARVAEARDTRWAATPQYLHTGLRGKKREQLVAWLVGGMPPIARSAKAGRGHRRA